MSHPLSMLHTSSFLHQFNCRHDILSLFPQFSCLSYRGYDGIQLLLGSMRSYHSHVRHPNRMALRYTEKCYIQEKHCECKESNMLLHIQTLRNFPMEKLFGEIVMVRFDCDLLFSSLDSENASLNRGLFTIKYLHNAGAKILLVSSWGGSDDSTFLSVEYVADYLSKILQIKVTPAIGYLGFKQLKTKGLETAEIILLDNLSKFKQELANFSEFSEKLSSGVNVFINDTFSLSHKILSSTVGVARFCYASLAGFHFEEELFQLMKTRECTKKPYIALIGGSNFLEKASALCALTSVCDGIIFVGMLALQVMNALRLSVPSCFVEQNGAGKALEFVHLAHSRDVQIYLPRDFWCVLDSDPKIVDVFPSNAILTGWTPVDLGPASLKETSSVLSECKKVLWIGPVRFVSFKKETQGASELASLIERISKNGCDVTVVGNTACKAVARTSSSLSSYKMFENASAVWKFLEGKSLPGVAALDKAYPSHLDWSSIFSDASQPLVVDIGSGNGVFILQMARRWKHFNFVGLEINKKLVQRCLVSILECDIRNGYFVSTNATSTFRSIISSYPGDLVLVSIQCPNPDFNREEHRWRMVQRALVDAIIDLLTINGKIFLQSDIELVIMRMKELFMLCGKSKLVVDGDGMLQENPFGMRSDWEQHVLDRGAPMYRVMISKVR